LLRLDPELLPLEAPRILEQPTLGRTRRTRAIRVVGAAVAGAHEEVRLGEPAHRTAEVGTVDGEDLEPVLVDAPDPAGEIGGRPVVRPPRRVPERRQPGLADRELERRAEGDPPVGALRLADRRREDVAEDRHGQERAGDAVEEEAELDERSAPRDRTGKTHGLFTVTCVAG